jgi:phosphodiesterase/alkaline phosphatase D-like protein
VVLETLAGATWNPIASVAVDNTDNLSSYTATFKIPGWNATTNTDYRIRMDVGGVPYHWQGVIRLDPVAKNELVVAAMTCQRLGDNNVQNDGNDWTPVDTWQPHTLAFTHIAKHQPDLLLALGDQIYEGQPTPADNSSDFNRHHDYLYKWSLWVLQARELTRDIPTIAIPDDHDVYQGNLWGEGGIATTDQNTGGYVRPASWVKMLERTQTSHLPDPDPYNPVQPPPAIAQGIGVYFTALVYGRVGVAVLEDRKFKTGRTDPPVDPAQQFLLGDRQHDFLRAFATDWDGQDLKFVASQSPLGNLHTHGSTGYNFGLNDRDTQGWPLHRRNEAWALLRLSRMFQVAGDQHLATVGHHGIAAPADAGWSFTVPAIANFFPRVWDPVHNVGGTTSIVSPYLGDFFFDGNGTLPDGITPNLTADDPAHVRIVAAANPLEYYRQTRGLSPANLHDRGAGYGIIRMDKTTRRITFECWPLHADPEFPQTGSQFSNWPVTIAQTDNDGRAPTGHLPLLDTHARKNAVVSVYDETTSELVYAMRIQGNLFRPPVYTNGTTYRVEIGYDDHPVSETFTNQVAAVGAPHALHRFVAINPSIVSGGHSTLQWDVEGSQTLTIDNGVGDVTTETIDGIGYRVVAPTTNTTYTLTSTPSVGAPVQATATVRVFPDKAGWRALYFTPAELANPALEATLWGDAADPDHDDLSNGEEFLFQGNPRVASPDLLPFGSVIQVGDDYRVAFTYRAPVYPERCAFAVQESEALADWKALPANSLQESARDDYPAEGTTRITVQSVVPLPGESPRRFYRSVIETP